MTKEAVLISNHQEIARLSVDALEYVYCMAGNPNAEDLLKVVDVCGTSYWCDSLEFINRRKCKGMKKKLHELWCALTLKCPVCGEHLACNDNQFAYGNWYCPNCDGNCERDWDLAHTKEELFKTLEENSK